MADAPKPELVKLFHSDGPITLKRFRYVTARLQAVDAALDLRRDKDSCSVWAPAGWPVRADVFDRCGLTAQARRVFANALNEPMAPIGRPRGSRRTELTACLNPVKVTPAQADTWKRCGGAAWLREQLDRLGSAQP